MTKRKGTHPARLTLGKIEFVMELPATFRDDQPAFELDDLKPFTEAVVRWVVGHAIMTPETFRFLRVQAGLGSKALAELFRVRAETVSRWESGALPLNVLAWQTIAHIALERTEGRRDTLERMQSVRDEFEAQTVTLKAS